MTYEDQPEDIMLFRAYATSTTFHLNLSLRQIEMLDAVKTQGEYYTHYMLGYSCWHMTARTLQEKGLIKRIKSESVDPEYKRAILLNPRLDVSYWVATQAGNLVHGLLEYAGLVNQDLHVAFQQRMKSLETREKKQ